MAETVPEPGSPIDQVMEEFEFRFEEKIRFQALVLAVMIGSTEEVVTGLYEQALDVFGQSVLEGALKRYDELVKLAA